MSYIVKMHEVHNRYEPTIERLKDYEMARAHMISNVYRAYASEAYGNGFENAMVSFHDNNNLAIVYNHGRNACWVWEIIKEAQ